MVQLGKSASKNAQQRQAADELRKQRVNPSTITPTGLVSLLDRFARTHGRTAVSLDGVNYVSSASGLVCHLAGLRQVFTAAGRSGDYADVPGSDVGNGNPADSQVVADYMAGYAQLHFDKGMDPVAAVPVTDGAARQIFHLTARKGRRFGRTAPAYARGGHGSSSKAKHFHIGLLLAGGNEKVAHPALAVCGAGRAFVYTRTCGRVRGDLLANAFVGRQFWSATWRQEDCYCKQ
jgi:hypothetical protein